jgi:hypothetical protein
MYKKAYNVEQKTIFSRGLFLIQKKGFFYPLKKFFYVYIFRYYSLFFLKSRRFLFKKVKLLYYYSVYNYTYANERTIEIPLMRSLIEESRVKDNKILEVGNVMSHYMDVSWDVMDKYESGEGIMGEDIAYFKPRKKYKIVFSISTMEHVGFDEGDFDNRKILKAIENIKENFLVKDGQFIFSVPIGWNPNLDKLIAENRIAFDSVYYFKRISWDNRWQISSKSSVMSTQFAKPYIGANGLLLGIIKNK